MQKAAPIAPEGIDLGPGPVNVILKQQLELLDSDYRDLKRMDTTRQYIYIQDVAVKRFRAQFANGKCTVSVGSVFRKPDRCVANIFIHYKVARHRIEPAQKHFCLVPLKILSVFDSIIFFGEILPNLVCVLGGLLLAYAGITDLQGSNGLEWIAVLSGIILLLFCGRSLASALTSRVDCFVTHERIDLVCNDIWSKRHFQILGANIQFSFDRKVAHRSGGFAYDPPHLKIENESELGEKVSDRVHVMPLKYNKLKLAEINRIFSGQASTTSDFGLPPIFWILLSLGLTLLGIIVWDFLN